MKTDGVRAVIFDLSGTVLDFGSRGPVVAFMELFARHGVPVTEAQARGPMGLHKRDHIQTMLSDPVVREQWIQKHRTEPDNEIVHALHAELKQVQTEVLEQHSELIPGVLETTAELDRRGIPFSTTTGFDSEMIGGLVRSVTAGGFRPKVFVCPDMAGGGRPAPWMAHYAAREMNVYPMSQIVKVGDTPADIAEAQNAGMWAVSVVASGNEIGLSRANLDALPSQEREARFAAARDKFRRLGARYVINSVAELMPVIDEIDRKIRNGER